MTATIDHSIRVAARYSGHLGTTPGGDRVSVEVELREISGTPRETTWHRKIAADEVVPELTISGTLYEGDSRRVIGSGQNIDQVEELTWPGATLRAGVTREDVVELVRVWRTWHLNTFTAGCAAQEPVWRDGRYGRELDLDAVPVCRQSGYRFGYGWLVEELPAPVISWVRDFGRKLNRKR